MSFPLVPLLMRPSFSPRPWGGTKLAAVLGKEVPAGERIGEAWELSDHPNGRSTIAGGAFDGRTFGEVVRAFPREMIGCAAAPERYPLLVKIIDAAEDLSIQVHPNDAQAARHGERGKTECWYVMDCDAGTEVIYGLKAGVTAEQVRAGAADGSLAGLVARHPLAAGDFLFVEAGTVHAILGGTVLCEIQQSSDATYRLWDWGREPKRELHLEDGLAAIDWRGVVRRPVAVPAAGELATPLTLTDNEYFCVRALDIPGGSEHALPDDLGPTGTVFVTVCGCGSLATEQGGVELARGGTAFLPAACEGAGRLRAAAGGVWRVLMAESRELGAP
ncbi:MAG: class I mannose-6-phosphate isomerase [Candidatus Sumerlaeia bacterium]|nr:class I mannose-6-phosphate isomerase [Candidatus Sumerlaeia bacterium]